jgi:uncharacterized membrane protein YedE/YeeE
VPTDGGLGLMAFHRAMSLNMIGVVAPITGFFAVAIPIGVGIVGGERLMITQMAGIAIGLVAIVLPNSSGDQHVRDARAGVGLAVLAGVLFGLWFVVFHAISSAGVVAFVGARLSSMAAFALGALSGTSMLTRRRAWPCNRHRRTVRWKA